MIQGTRVDYINNHFHNIPIFILKFITTSIAYIYERAVNLRIISASMISLRLPGLHIISVLMSLKYVAH